MEYTPKQARNTPTCSDCQTNTKNICTKFHEKILKGSQEIEEHRSKWTQKNPPKWLQLQGSMPLKILLVQWPSQWYQKHLYKISQENTEMFLTHFSPVLYCYTPENIRKSSGFLMFSAGIAMHHWAKMG